MMRLSGSAALFGCILSSVVYVFPAAARSQEKVAIEWRFDTDGDFQGWAASGHVRDAAVTGGALVGRSVDWDPILLSPAFEIPAAPAQRVEIRMRASEAAEMQLFWTETLEGEHGGFSEKKSDRLTTLADNQFHVYRSHPFWHAAGKIIRLRLDPPASGEFAIQWIRIVDEPALPRSEADCWEFDAGSQGWRAWRELSDPIVRDGALHVTAQGRSPILMSPMLAVPADENPYVCIRMATENGQTGRLFCVSRTQIGWEDTMFPLVADGKMHSYNVDVGHLPAWQDEIIMLGIQPTDAEGADVRIESVAITDSPCGPAEIEVGYFGRADGVNRAGRPAEITLSVRNRGGEAVENLVATITVPDRVKVLTEARQRIGTLTRWLPKTASWQIESSTPGEVELGVEAKAPGVQSAAATATIELTPAPQVPEGPYIPEPQPVESKYDVGVFYFPGWHSMARWQPILDFPLRKPVLGWYDEANPECADWQIKWAVEHGISFFMVDWYWCRGSRQLEHWLHDAYMKAKFRKYLKWAIMWANHNPPNTHSAEDWLNVTQYWIDHYFGMEEYYRIDGRPAVFIWAPANVRRDLGGSQQAATLYAMSQQMARDAGYGGIYFVAMSSHESEGKCQELKAEGYEAFTSYHGFQLAAGRAGSRRFPFADVVETSPEVWRQADERSSGLVYVPIVDTGWSSEPWHRSKALVISDRTPELFGQLCRKAAEYADRTGKKIIALGPCNEWGEGSYIEPYAQYAFQDLDQLRQAFCPPGDWPPNLIPSDVGRGPYDLPRIEPKTVWEFNTDGDLEGWVPNGQLNVEVKGGILAGESTGHDPILQGSGIEVEADSTRLLSIRMRASADDRAQVFWGTTVSGQSEANSARFDVVGDGQFHEYEIDLGESRKWRGLVVSLRFDPAGKPGVQFAVDWIRFR